MIRILSDLHWGHKASLLKDLGDLEPLLEEPSSVIFNGDTLEQIYEDAPAHLSSPLPTLQEFQERLASCGSRLIFTTGNHDPKISGTHYCELNGGEILITHGDGIFPEIAPWSKNAPILKEAACRRLQQRAQQGSTCLHSFLQAIKEASIEEHERQRDYDPTVWGKLLVFAHLSWPPTRPWTILKCWKEAPQRAVEMCRDKGKTPRFIVIGHTHKPCVQRLNGTVVINTGSFFPWPGATAVDICSNGIQIRKISRRRKRFALGETLARFELQIDLESLTLSKTSPSSGK